MVAFPTELIRILASSPNRDGGTPLVLATSRLPPAMAMLSTGDVVLVDGELRVAVHASSSVADVDGGVTLLVPGSKTSFRIEVMPVTVVRRAKLAVISGPVVAIRPMAEPPWLVEMSFIPQAGSDPGPFVEFWASLRVWLQGGASGDPPALPEVTTK